MTKFYTGLPSFAVFLRLFNYLTCNKIVYWRESTATRPERSRMISIQALEPINQLLATLIRLRLGLCINGIADRFGISSGTCSQYFTTWLCLMHKELKPLNIFPSRDVIQRNMPHCFVKYPNLRVILDCTEIFAQRSSSLIN